MLFDSHTHSGFSPDADKGATIEKMSARAAELGLDFVTVTDHCDCNYWLPENEFEYQQYQKSDSMMFGCRDYATKSIEHTLALKAKCPDLLCGVELGQPLQNIDAAKQILSHEGLDFVIGSLHMNRGERDFYYIEYNKMDSSGLHCLLDNYFSEIYEMCQQDLFDSLGHLTYPLRYIVGEYGIAPDMSRYDDIIREIFSTLIHNGRAIEINTSGYRQKYGKPFPDERYLKLYRSLGGELITIGSDAHKLADIGAGLTQGCELLRDCGFRYITLFKNRKSENYKL